MQTASPFVVTLQLDDSSDAFFNDMRRRYFPPALNYLSAHLTLFHHLPSTEMKIEEDLQRWADQFQPFSLNVVSVVSLGKGVAYKLESSELLRLHKQLQREWQPWLTPQDRQGLWPHVTVQNKVSPRLAKEMLAHLQQTFTPFTAQALGFKLWLYEGGPWRFVRQYLLAES